MFDIHKKWSIARSNKFNAADCWATLLLQWKATVKQWNVKFHNIPYESILWSEKQDQYYIVHIKITASERLRKIKAFW